MTPTNTPLPGETEVFCTWCKMATAATHSLTRSGHDVPFCKKHAEEFKKPGEEPAKLKLTQDKPTGLPTDSDQDP